MSVLREIFFDLENSHKSYLINCDMLRCELNTKFDTDIVDDILWQPSDGFVILWDGKNSTFDIGEISKLKSIEEFLNYLKENQVS